MGGGGGKGGGGVQYVPAQAPTLPEGPTQEELIAKEEELAAANEEARKSYASEMEARRQLQASASALGGEDDNAKIKKPSLLGGGM